MRLLSRRAHHEPLAALRAAALEDSPPRSRRISLAKPVLAVAADLARLVRALHDDWPPESEKRGKKARTLMHVNHGFFGSTTERTVVDPKNASIRNDFVAADHPSIRALR